MSGSPFPADPELAARRGRLRADLGAELARQLARALADAPDPRHPAAVVPAAVVAELVARLDLHGAEEAAILALDAAASIAHAPISGYRVGVVGIGATSGDLLLGGNQEFPGASIGHTIHAEGFATLLARARGERLETLVSPQARPCAHCRQVLVEMDGGLDLRLVDPLGHDLRLGDLIPWPFSPADLGQAGVVPGRTPGSPSGDLAVADLAAPGDIAVALEVAGALAHAPYSRCPAAVALRLADGSVVAGAVLESVAFNPTIGPLEDALVGLVAAGRASVEIREAWLAERRGALVNHAAPARDLLAAVAPAVGLQTTYWR